MSNYDTLQLFLNSRSKQSVVAAPGGQPQMMPPPGAPPMPPPGMPMDPAMMGGPQGMPPPGMPMDPAMMGAPPMPPPGMPMDPAMMGGPQGMPMDPSMMMPPPGMAADPAMMGAAPPPTPPAEPASEGGKAKKMNVEQEIADIKEMLQAMMEAQIAIMQTLGGGMPSAPAPAPAPPMPAQGMQVTASDKSFDEADMSNYLKSIADLLR